MKKLSILLIIVFASLSCDNKTKKIIEKSNSLSFEQEKTTSYEKNNENNLPSSNFAEIVDKDGYVNVRNEANSQSEIIGKINSGEIVYIFNIGDYDGNWLNIDFKKGDSVLTGFIHKSRLKPISEYEYIPPVSKVENEAEFYYRNIKVIIKSEPFNYQANEKYFTEEQLHDDYVVQKYKGQEIWGTDGTIPRTHYTSITVRIGNQIIEIPKKEIENLFNVNNELASCYLNEKNETLYITLKNSDGAGSYEVLFIIEKEKYKGRKVYYSN